MDSDLYNKAGNPKYKYYYSDATSIATAMESAAGHFGKKNL